MGPNLGGQSIYRLLWGSGYRPGSRSRGCADGSALAAACAASAGASISASRGEVNQAQPDPVLSGVHIVVERASWVERWKPAFRFVLAIAA